MCDRVACQQGAILRVTGGTARGVSLVSPKAPGVRPTTDRVRSALFNILTQYGLDGVVIADLFAGTGSLGIEALSRGAAHADFVEADRRQITVIKSNLRATGFADRSTVLAGKAEEITTRLGLYDYVVMDPPYSQPFPTSLIVKLGSFEVLAANGILICGHATRVTAPERCGTLARWDDRRYGDTSLAFYSPLEEVVG